MGKSSFIFILLILLISSCTKNQDLEPNNTDGIVHHFEFINNNNLNNKSRLLMEQGELDDALNVAKQIECYGLMCRFKNILISEIYLKKDNERKSLEFLEKAISQGHSRTYIKDAYKSIESQVNEIYQLNYDKYEKRIQLELRSKIIDCVRNDQSSRNSRDWNRIMKVDSFNRLFLDSITRFSGWIGVNEIGHTLSSERSDPTILVLHMDSLSKSNYLQKIKTSCLKNETNWWRAMSVFSSVFNRNKDEDNCFGTNELYYDEFGNILENKSSFFIESLRNSIVSNRELIIIRPGKELDLTIKGKVLKQIKNLLIKKGVKSDKIKLEFDTAQKYALKPFKITIEPNRK